MTSSPPPVERERLSINFRIRGLTLESVRHSLLNLLMMVMIIIDIMIRNYKLSYGP